ncbi:MAG: right-handed parallel beta-helix repeat-containing protein [Bacteroidota bacterium]
MKTAILLAALLASCGRRGEVPVIEVAASPGETGRAFYVDAQHPRASDVNPGTEAEPWRTISRATGRGVLRPGDTVWIREGVYRESVTPHEGGRPGARIAFRAVPGELVVITGADPATDWRPQPDGSWRHAWTGPGLPSYADDPVFRRELVVHRGQTLRPVWAREDLIPGTFWAEGDPEAPRALYARLDGGPEAVEVAHRTYLFRPLGADPDPDCGARGTPGYFHLSGLTFRHAANRAQWGAVCLGSAGSLVDDVRVEWTNGRGIDVSGREHIVHRTASDFNGQMGWGGGCVSCLIEDSRAVGNNWKGYDPFWEAGGAKWARSTDSVYRRFLARDNDGPGIWLDIDNADNTVEASVVENNLVAGIMLELRTVRTLVQHNTVRGTRWREWSGSGVLSQAASHNVLLHNTIEDNEGSGIWLRLDPSRRAEDGHTLVARNLVLGNVMRRDVEARQLSVEGTSPEHVRTHTFRHNVFGPVRDVEPVWRSTFFVHPTGREGGFRSDDLAEWRRLVTAEGNRSEVGEALPDPGPLPLAGAAGASARATPTIGAAPEAVGLR